MTRELYEEHELRHEAEVHADDEAEERRYIESLAAADGGEESDTMDESVKKLQVEAQRSEQLAARLRATAPAELVEMRKAIDVELKRRQDELQKQLAEVQHAVNGTSKRRTRSDAGSKRGPKLVAVEP
jgi:hypothetical protein